MRRPRLTIRRLMIVIGILGLITGFIVEGQRRRVRFEAVVEEQLNQAMRYFVLLPGGESEEQRRLMRIYGEKFGPILTYHKTMMEKYEWAARFPWLPVPADPPVPPTPSDPHFPEIPRPATPLGQGVGEASLWHTES